MQYNLTGYKEIGNFPKLKNFTAPSSPDKLQAAVCMNKVNVT
jgi:hypothetical protein